MERTLARRVRLWRAFWLVFVPVVFAVPLAIQFCMRLVIHLQPGTMLFFRLSVSGLLTFTTMALLALMVSRSAANTSHPVLGFLARTTVVVYLLWLGRRIVGGLIVVYHLY